MAGLISNAPLSMALIGSIVLIGMLASSYGWRHSTRSRRLVKFAWAVILGLMAVFLILSWLQRTLFPLPPV
ncbi:MAG TPA: hypothetical protein VJK02_25455 [Anaerolineales bacterium]|nr:hypothetical protein [Anaerolineales bacterium]